MGAAPRLLCFTIIFSEVLPILRTIRGSPYFPRQPNLPESVFLSLVQTENTEWERSQLIKDFMRLNKKAANHSEVITIGQMNEDFLMNQLHYKYFEGDIIGYETTWSNGKVVLDTVYHKRI